MFVLLVPDAAQDLAHLDGGFLIQRLEEVVGSGVAQSVAQMVTTRQDTLGQRVAQIRKTSAIKRVLGSDFSPI